MRFTFPNQNGLLDFLVLSHQLNKHLWSHHSLEFISNNLMKIMTSLSTQTEYEKLIAVFGLRIRWMQRFCTIIRSTYWPYLSWEWLTCSPQSVDQELVDAKHWQPQTSLQNSGGYANWRYTKPMCSTHSLCPKEYLILTLRSPVNHTTQNQISTIWIKN